MSGYNIEYFIKDFAERTKFNLEYINNHKDIDGPYEITQMINSLLGIIILPVEKYKDSYIRPLKKDQAKFDESKSAIKNIMDNCKNDNRYRSTYWGSDDPLEFLRRLRNAVSHSGNNGLHFYPLTESGENVSSVIFYDINDKNDSEFCVHLTIEELEVITQKASDLYVILDKKAGKKAKYEIAVEELQTFLKKGKREKTVADIIQERCNELDKQSNNKHLS